MTEQAESAFDLFISYAEADREWVDGFLLPRLQQAALKTIYESDFVLGVPRIDNIERAILQSRHTAVILTPDWLNNEWNTFEGLLVRTLDPSARKRRLLAILRKPCQLPPSLAALQLANFTQQRYWNKECKRLVRDIQRTRPVLPPWEIPGGMQSSSQWRKWLWAQQRLVGRWLLLASVLGVLWFVFVPRPTWVSQTWVGPNVITVHNTGAVLLAGADNNQNGCTASPKGIWYRKLIGDSTWQESDVGDLLCYQDQATEALSNINAFASQPAAPQVVYALTSRTGIIVSTDGGARFHPYPAGIPATDQNNPLLHIAIGGTAAHPALWVAAERGLWRSDNKTWKRLDGQGDQGCAGLPELSVTALLWAEPIWLIGSQERGLWLSKDDGHTCRLVFDTPGQYTFAGLWSIPTTTHKRYLALVKDHRKEARATDVWQLQLLCPRLDSCSAEQWTAESTPVWSHNEALVDVIVQKTTGDEYVWYAVSDLFGKVWQGAVPRRDVTAFPLLVRCFPFCNAALAPSADNGMPVLLAGNREFHYETGAWWRQLWP